VTKKWESRLYTPRPLIRKPKVYTTRAKKRNYETRGAFAEATAATAREVLLLVNKPDIPRRSLF
jgi:hypothetical protein